MTTIAISNHQLGVVIALSMVLLLLVNEQRLCVAAAYIAAPHAVAAGLPPQLLLNELLANGNDDTGGYYTTQLKKYQHQQQQQQQQQRSYAPANYLAKWPGLRDLLLTIGDYDDNGMDSNEQANMRFVERLRQLSDNVGTAELDDERFNSFGNEEHDSLTNMPAKKYSNGVTSTAKLSASMKDHGTKKNVQYMSPCHFKICNMGRKRNAHGSFDQY